MIRVMGETEPILLSLENGGSSTNFKDAFSKLEEHLNKNSTGCCRNIRLEPHTENVTVEEQCIYVTYLWTLAEERWITKRSRPYNRETCPDNPVGNIQQDYQFDPPQTTILNPPELSISKDLDKTRRREDCSQCQNDEQIQCSHCKNRRSILTWTQLTVKWSNIRSSFLYSTNSQSLYPEAIIPTVVNKIKCLDFDDIWPSNSKTLDRILDQCYRLPEGFRNEINKKFLSHQKSDKILRLKCLIECFHIEKIIYQLNGLPSKIINIKDFL